MIIVAITSEAIVLLVPVSIIIPLIFITLIVLIFYFKGVFIKQLFLQSLLFVTVKSNDAKHGKYSKQLTHAKSISML